MNIAVPINRVLNFARVAAVLFVVAGRGRSGRYYLKSCFRSIGTKRKNKKLALVFGLNSHGGVPF